MHADVLLDYDVLSVGNVQRLYLLARLRSGTGPPRRERRPLNVALVVDRSGSMAGSKIEYTRQAAQTLVSNLGPQDRISVVLYNENVETLLPPQLVQNKDALAQRLAGIKAGGTTNLSGGWLEGANHVATHRTDEAVNRVILMTDGLANRGVVEPRQLVDMLLQRREAGVSTTTMGLGEDFNEDLLIALADAGGGAFYYIESPELVPSFFAEELNGLLSVVGQNLIVTLEGAPPVIDARQLNQYPASRDNHHRVYRLGDVYAEDSKHLVLELALQAPRTPGELNLGTLVFRYDELHEGCATAREVRLPLVVQVGPEATPAQGEGGVTVVREVLLLHAAQARRLAIQLADNQQFGEAARLLREAADEIVNSGLTDRALREEATALRDQAAMLAQGAENYLGQSRKMMATQAYYTGRAKHEDTVAMRLREAARRRPEEALLDNLDNPNNPNNPPPEANAIQDALARLRQQPPAPSEPVPPASDVPPTHLVWHDQPFPLAGSVMRVGRAPQNEIVIDVPGVSRFHCQLTPLDGGWQVEDLGSTNGTVLRGQRVTAPTTAFAGDVLALSDQTLTFTAPDAPAHERATDAAPQEASVPVTQASQRVPAAPEAPAPTDADDARRPSAPTPPGPNVPASPDFTGGWYNPDPGESAEHPPDGNADHDAFRPPAPNPDADPPLRPEDSPPPHN